MQKIRSICRFCLVWGGLSIPFFLAACGDRGSQNPDASSKPAVVDVSAVEVKTAPRLQDFKAEGSLDAGRDTLLTAPASGPVLEPVLSTVQDVDANQVILTLSLEETELELKAKQSELRATQAELEALDIALDEQDEAAQKTTKPQEADGEAGDAKEAHARALELKLDQLESEIALIEFKVNKGTLTAPFEGLLTPMKDLYAGERVTEGTALYRLVAFNPLALKFLMPTDDAQYLTEGTSVSFASYLNTARVVSGPVTRVTAYPKNPELAQISATLANADHALKIGQTGEVRILSTSESKTLFVPRTAIMNQGAVVGDPQVFVIRGDRATLTAVSLGKPRGDQIEVLSGVRLGEWVAVSNLDLLVTGTPVKVRRLH